MAQRHKMARWGLPILAGVLILIIAITRVGAGSGTGDEDDPRHDDEYLVEQVTIDEAEVLIAESFPVQILVVARGYMPDPCWTAQEPDIVEDGNRITIEILAERKADEMCAQVLQDYEQTFNLGTMDPGSYVVVVNGVEQEFEVS